MKYGINTLDDFDLRGKTVLCRLDLNSPLDIRSREITDPTRICRSLPTIKELVEQGARVALLTHQGGDLEYQNYGSTKAHARFIAESLHHPVDFVDDICGPAAREKIGRLDEGQVLMLDNVRYLAEELTLFETRLNLTFEEQARTLLVQKLSPLGELFVLDAFAAAHRSQPSIVGFPRLLPSAMGRLFEEELDMLHQVVEEPRRPSLFILGGAKVQDAFDIMTVVLKEAVADSILTGGLVANIFLIASGQLPGQSTVDYVYNHNLSNYVEKSKEILAGYRDKVILPLDYAYTVEGRRQEVAVESLPVPGPLADIGRRTVDLYREGISRAGTLFVNGPMGIFEKKATAWGTQQVWQAVAASPAFSVLGGGDSIRAANEFCDGKAFSYISTAGGGLVRFLSGEELPAIKSLRQSARRFRQSRVDLL